MFPFLRVWKKLCHYQYVGKVIVEEIKENPHERISECTGELSVDSLTADRERGSLGRSKTIPGAHFWSQWGADNRWTGSRVTKEVVEVMPSFSLQSIEQRTREDIVAHFQERIVQVGKLIPQERLF